MVLGLHGCCNAAKKGLTIENGQTWSYNLAMSDALAPLTPDAMLRASDWLSHGGLRPTRQRQTLAALLVGDGADRHVTAESLFSASQNTGEKVSLATVYNTLKAFCDAGLMQEVTVDGARSYFDTRMDQHPHFYWESTHELVDAPAEGLQITGLPQAPEGAVVSRVDVVIRLRHA